MCLVIFAWLINQEYFKELTDNDIRKKLEREKDFETFENHLPAGFRIGGNDSETFKDKDGDVWEVVNYDPYKIF